jgi:hypothetical protein
MEIRFLIASIIVGFGLGFSIFTVPVFLFFQQSLNDCSKFLTEDGCHASPHAECIWQPERNKCVFPDFQTINCSIAHGNPDLCSDTSVFGSNCQYAYRTDTCVHISGWNQLETGGFASAAIFGGGFGPFLIGQIDQRKGHVFSLSVLSVCAFVGAGLFSWGIEQGSYALWLIPRVFASMVSYSGPALLPNVLRFVQVEESNRLLFLRLLGLSIALCAFVTSLFLYLQSESMPYVEIKGVKFFFENPKVQHRLQGFNSIEYFLGVFYGVFAFMVHLATPIQSESRNASNNKEDPVELISKPTLEEMRSEVEMDTSGGIGLLITTTDADLKAGSAHNSNMAMSQQEYADQLRFKRITEARANSPVNTYEQIVSSLSHDGTSVTTTTTTKQVALLTLTTTATSVEADRRSKNPSPTSVTTQKDQVANAVVVDRIELSLIKRDGDVLSIPYSKIVENNNNTGEGIRIPSTTFLETNNNPSATAATDENCNNNLVGDATLQLSDKVQEQLLGRAASLNRSNILANNNDDDAATDITNKEKPAKRSPIMLTDSPIDQLGSNNKILNGSQQQQKIPSVSPRDTNQDPLLPSASSVGGGSSTTAAAAAAAAIPVSVTITRVIRRKVNNNNNENTANEGQVKISENTTSKNNNDEGEHEEEKTNLRKILLTNSQSSIWSEKRSYSGALVSRLLASNNFLVSLQSLLLLPLFSSHSSRIHFSLNSSLLRAFLLVRFSLRLSSPNIFLRQTSLSVLDSTCAPRR